MTAEKPKPEDCPGPFWHKTHRYCPACSWTESGEAGEGAGADPLAVIRTEGAARAICAEVSGLSPENREDVGDVLRALVAIAGPPTQQEPPPPDSLEGEVRRLRGRLKQIALYVGWDRSDAWKVEAARLTAQNALDESPATQPTPSVDEGEAFKLALRHFESEANAADELGLDAFPGSPERLRYFTERDVYRYVLKRLREATQQPAEPTNGEAG